MRMERTQQNSGVKWQKPLPPRNWNTSMMPSISRPSSRVSRIGGSLPKKLHDVDWINLGGISSGTNSVFESPPHYGYHRGRPKRQGKIEDMLAKHSSLRPRSISLAKYEPLPSIGKDSPRKKLLVEPKRASSVGSLSKENNDPHYLVEQTRSDEGPLSKAEVYSLSMESIDNSLEEPDVESSATVVRPKLIRSRTFDVIETNLTNLPVIDEPTNSEILLDDPNEAFPDENLYFEFPEKSHVYRPSSHSSLITHPGTPDSGFVAQSAPLSGSSHEMFSGDYYDHDENFDLESSETVKPIFHNFSSSFTDDTQPLEISDIP